MKLNDPQLVRDEYASEAGLEARRSIHTRGERRHVESMGVLRGERVEVLEFEGPLRATRRVSIFVASP